MIKCINCNEEHKEKFIEYDLVGDAWCMDCLGEELELDLKESVK